MLLETSICTKLEDKKEMPNYGNPNLNLQQPQIMGQQQIPAYGNGGMLVNANPYNNYMINKDIPPYQFLKCRPVSSRD
jgi:hypothetical protein